jgi:hypothetical protein
VDARTHRRVITYDDVVQAGIDRFLREATIDMEGLAEDLAVSRATLYRVAPGRDRVIGDVLWTLADAIFERARARVAGEDVESVIAVLRRFGRVIMDAEPFRTFITREPETATRVLFTPAGAVHERFVAANRRLLEERIAHGRLRLPFEVDTAAYVFARIYESMWYADLLSGREPDLEVADRAARAVLSAA